MYIEGRSFISTQRIIQVLDDIRTTTVGTGENIPSVTWEGTQLLLTWPCNIMQCDCALSSGGTSL